LGKGMSRGAGDVSQQQCDPTWQEDVSIEGFLTPADLPDPSALRVFDLVSIHPVPLIRNARMRGWFYRTLDGTWLPARMRFGVDRLPDGGQRESDKPSRRRRGRRSSPDAEG